MNMRQASPAHEPTFWRIAVTTHGGRSLAGSFLRSRGMVSAPPLLKEPNSLATIWNIRWNPLLSWLSLLAKGKPRGDAYHGDLCSLTYLASDVSHGDAQMLHSHGVASF
jgi:hypothetical protein